MPYTWNRFREADVPPTPPPAGARAYHQSLPAYSPSPLRLCPGIAGVLGLSNLYVKDESTRFGLNSFKALGASWAMSRLVERAGSIPVFAAATDGNHGRAVAWMARQLKAAAHIFVQANTHAGRIKAIENHGAEVRVVAGRYDDAVRACAEESAANGWQVVADIGYEGYMEVPEWIVEGYQTMFLEFEEQRAARSLPPPDVVLVQAGVGGLLCAAARHFRGESNPVHLVSVEPMEAAALMESIATKEGAPRSASGAQDSVMEMLNCGEVSLTAWPDIRRSVELFLTIEDAAATDAVALLSRALIPSAPTGAAGLAGLLALCRDPRVLGAKAGLAINEESRVLVINTEGPVPASRPMPRVKTVT